MTTHAILSLADELHQHQLAESTLPRVTAKLTLDEQILQDLIQVADAASRKQPRLGWAIMAVTDAAAAHSPSTRLQAQAAWHLARLANEYHHPPKARTALARARRLFDADHEPGWLAACTWQEHALPIANKDIPQSITALHTALQEMEAAGAEFKPFLPHCHLTLQGFSKVRTK